MATAIDSLDLARENVLLPLGVVRLNLQNIWEHHLQQLPALRLLPIRGGGGGTVVQFIVFAEERLTALTHVGANCETTGKIVMRSCKFQRVKGELILNATGDT